MTFHIPKTCPRLTPAGTPCGQPVGFAQEDTGPVVKCRTCGHIVASVVPPGQDATHDTIALPATSTRTARAIVMEAVKAAIPDGAPAFDRDAVRATVIDQLKVNAKYLAVTFGNRAEDLVDDTITTVINQRAGKRSLRRSILAELRANPEFIGALVQADDTIDAAIDKEGDRRGMVPYGNQLITRDELAARAGKMAIARGWDGLKLGNGFGKRIKLGEATRPQLRTEAGHQGRVETEARTRKVFYLTLADAMPDDQKTVQEVFTDDDLQGAFARSMPAQTPALVEAKAIRPEATEPEA